MTEHYEDSELMSRQRLMLGYTQEDAVTMIVDAAVHLALVYGGTVQAHLADVMAQVPWSPSDWEIISENFREDLGITKLTEPNE